ncbi:TetR family transcriptional regulator [Streptomyces oceani]|uniref:TetR family transcriptional regulator n=2 Tax=Streptomyces oceani TaxID=1075402 RepID=A0A1E7KEV8_9ACTN|nr:TetR family transcriptional regulator [Streptomyces oceani]
MDSATRGQQTRDRLLDAAVQLIVEEGWGAVTTRKMAERAGVRPGVVHYHFDTVTDLLVEASLDATRRELGKALDALQQQEGPAGLEEVLHTVGSYSSDDPIAVLLSETLLAATRIEKLREQLSELMREWRAMTAGWLEAQGAPDPEATATVLGAALDGLVLHCLLDPQLRTAPLTDPLERLVGLDSRPVAEAADG